MPYVISASVLLFVLVIVLLALLNKKIEEDRQILAAGHRYYQLGQQRLAAGKIELQQGYQRYNAGQSRLDNGQMLYQSGMAHYEKITSPRPWFLGLGILSRLVIAPIMANKLDEGAAALADGQRQLQEGRRELREGEDKIASGARQLELGRQELLEGQQKLEGAKQLRILLYILLLIIPAVALLAVTHTAGRKAALDTSGQQQQSTRQITLPSYLTGEDSRN